MKQYLKSIGLNKLTIILFQTARSHVVKMSGSSKFLGPKLIRAAFIRKYSSNDRPFSTAVGITDEYYNDVYEYKIEKVGVLPKEYSEIPGPKELPFIGNAWRFAPFIGELIFSYLFF